MCCPKQLDEGARPKAATAVLGQYDAAVMPEVVPLIKGFPGRTAGLTQHL